MIDGQIYYNPKYKVYHIKGWGYSFKTKDLAKRFKKQKMKVKKLQKQLYEEERKLDKIGDKAVI